MGIDQDTAEFLAAEVIAGRIDFDKLTPKMQRCVKQVWGKNKNVNPYAVCVSSIGEEGAFNDVDNEWGGNLLNQHKNSYTHHAQEASMHELKNPNKASREWKRSQIGHHERAAHHAAEISGLVSKDTQRRWWGNRVSFHQNKIKQLKGGKLK